MKTQEFKNSETVKSSNLIMLFSMIVICEILLFTSGAGKSNHASDEMTPKFVIPIQQISFSTIVNQELEKEKLYSGMKLKEKSLNSNIEICQNPNPGNEFTMAKLNEYLILEKEPALDVNTVQSIVFPVIETADSKAVAEVSNSGFLKELKIQASEKVRMEVEIYAFERKLREYLAVEKEIPMELEDWMINKKCWCPELKESLAFSEEK